MKVYRVMVSIDTCPYFVTRDDCDDLREWLTDMEPGNALSVECLEMTEEEYAALPEWEGP